MIRSTSTGKQRNFAFTWTLSPTGRKEDGSNCGQGSTLTRLAIERPENRKIKETTSDICKWKWGPYSFFTLIKSLSSATKMKQMLSSTFYSYLGTEVSIFQISSLILIRKMRWSIKGQKMLSSPTLLSTRKRNRLRSKKKRQSSRLTNKTWLRM